MTLLQKSTTGLCKQIVRKYRTGDLSCHLPSAVMAHYQEVRNARGASLVK